MITNSKKQSKALIHVMFFRLSFINSLGNIKVAERITSENYLSDSAA